jgi:predicted PhzF superfamily epimerase YddE/YHI9
MIMTRIKLALVLFSIAAMPGALLAAEPTVQVVPPNLHGPRQLQDQTATAVVQDYLESWQNLAAALRQNRTDLLDQDFTGTAKTKLTDTIHQQAALGLHTRYQDRAHKIQIVFYSPDGLSVQLVDDVEYEEKVVDRQKVLATQHTHARYIVVMTPAETRWRVRIFQAEPE